MPISTVHIIDKDKDKSLMVAVNYKETGNVVELWYGDEHIDTVSPEQWIEFIVGTFDVPMLLSRLNLRT